MHPHNPIISRSVVACVDGKEIPVPKN
jgi:hypothetical protein